MFTPEFGGRGLFRKRCTFPPVCRAAQSLMSLMSFFPPCSVLGRLPYCCSTSAKKSCFRRPGGHTARPSTSTQHPCSPDDDACIRGSRVPRDMRGCCGLTSGQVEACGAAQAFSRRPDGDQQVPEGVVHLGVLQGVVPQGPEQLPLGVLRPPWSEARSPTRHTGGRQEDVGGGLAARQSAEQVVAEVRGGGGHLGCGRGEQLHVLLLADRLLAARVRLEQMNTASWSRGQHTWRLTVWRACFKESLSARRQHGVRKGAQRSRRGTNDAHRAHRAHLPLHSSRRSESLSLRRRRALGRRRVLQEACPYSSARPRGYQQSAGGAQERQKLSRLVFFSCYSIFPSGPSSPCSCCLPPAGAPRDSASLSVSLFPMPSATGWSLMVALCPGSSLSMRSWSGAGLVTMPMKSGAREASSTRAKRKGELTENCETERMEVTTVVADASTPSSLSSMALAWRTPVTLSGRSEIPERSGAKNRDPRPDGARAEKPSINMPRKKEKVQRFFSPMLVSASCSSWRYCSFTLGRLTCIVFS
ncbi:hypothetical protein EYF80_042342 [Liparis tanakae]|uniref:Uncharacterized protein n=1 Tax=Liparis tanakae TaxID=230148 RepID=A0A4Z2G1T3_9TELE|nr:hypothetical protein EYF80_042342 [Liparis tanakae]